MAGWLGQEHLKSTRVGFPFFKVLSHGNKGEGMGRLLATTTATPSVLHSHKYLKGTQVLGMTIRSTKTHYLQLSIKDGHFKDW